MKIDTSQNWHTFTGLMWEVLTPKIHDPYFKMFAYLAPDRVTSEGTLLGARNAPAGKGNHHAFRGGLVQHMLEMWDCWQTMKPFFQHQAGESWDSEHLSDERILRCILNHDLHKAWKTFKLVTDDPWEVVYSEDPSEKLMTWDTKTMFLLLEHSIPMDELQMNALLWSSGGWSEIKPKWQSVLAKAAYLLDEASGNVVSRLRDETLMNVRIKSS